MTPSVSIIREYNLDETTKSIWGISRSYDNVFLDSDIVGILDLAQEDAFFDSRLTGHAADYLRVISKMLDEWQRIRCTEPSYRTIASYGDRLDSLVGRLEQEGGDGDLDGLMDYREQFRQVEGALEARVVRLDDGPMRDSLYAHLGEMLEVFDEKIGIVKTGDDERERMIHQVGLMYVLTLTRKGECAVLASEQGYEGLITIPYRNLLAREIDDPDSPLNVLRGSRVTAILPDDNGKFRRNFVSSWVSPNDRVFVTVGGVEDVDARDRIIGIVRDVRQDLVDLGFSGEKYRLDIRADQDTLEEMFGDLVQKIPKPDENQGHIRIDSLVPVWEKLAEVCGVLGFHSKRDEALRHLGSVRGRRFALEIERLKEEMDAITDSVDWYSDAARLEDFQRVQKEMMVLLDRRRRR